METKKMIVLFDGVCNLCNGSVQFIIKRDKMAKFRFVSLQPETGQNYLAKYNYDSNDLESIVLLEDKKLFTKSDAVLRISSLFTLCISLIVRLTFC